jgi:hypothetical protein
MRAVMSGPLPAAAVTIMRTGFAGYCGTVCARTGLAMTNVKNAAVFTGFYLNMSAPCHRGTSRHDVMVTATAASLFMLKSA